MRRAVILLVAVLFASLALSAGATTPSAPPWAVAQVTYAVLHPVKIVGGTLSKTGTHFDMVSTFGYARDPSGSWDLTGNEAK